MKIISLLHQRECARDRCYGHVPSVEHFGREFHSIGRRLAFALRRFWEFELPDCRCLLAEVNEIVIGRATTIFGILPFINWLNAFGGSVIEHLLQERKASGALAFEHSTL